jgi:hypothetical protein
VERADRHCCGAAVSALLRRGCLGIAAVRLFGTAAVRLLGVATAR